MKKLLQQQLMVSFCLLVFMFLSFPGRAQDVFSLPGKISLKLTDTDVATVIREIDRQTSYSFTYNSTDLQKNKVPAIDFSEATLGAVLQWLQKELSLEFSLNGNTISVRPGKKEEKKLTTATSQITGRVVDFETAQPLPGATVTLLETGKMIVTDAKGFYRFNELKEGNYTLSVSYVGYQKNIVGNLTVASGKELREDLKMQAGSAGAALDEVVVRSGNRRVTAVTYSTDKDLMNEIRTSRAIVSGISNEQITKTADRNAAEVVRRISGVTVTDDRFIVVRGMNQRYNLTYLNDNIAPSTELYSRAFAYDLLPSPIIDRILIYKSPTAELLGDYSGGAIKVFTKNAKPVRHLDIGIQTGIRQGTTFKKVNAYNGGKTDWLGIDDGTRKLPAALGNFLSNYSKNNLSVSQMANLFTPDLTYGTRTATPDLQLFANYFDNWRISKWRLYNLTSVTYTRELRRFMLYNQTGNTYKLGGDNNINTNFNNTISETDQSFEIARINVLQNLTLKINKNHQFEFGNFFSNDGRSYTFIQVARPNMNEDIFIGNAVSVRNLTQTLGFQQRTLYSGNLGGKHSFGAIVDSAATKHQLRWNLGYTFARQNVPDQRQANFRAQADIKYGHNKLVVSNYTTAADDAEYQYVSAGSNIGLVSSTRGMIGRLFQRNNEQLYNGSLDYTFRVTPTFRGKAGNYNLYRLREVGRRYFRINRGGLGGGLYIENLGGAGFEHGNGVNNRELIEFRPMDLHKVWSDHYFRDDETGLKVYDVSSPVDKYLASEQNNALYVMGDWEGLDHKLIVNGGVRAERNLIQLSGAVNDGIAMSGNFKAVWAEELKTVFLPSLNVSYQPDETWVIRAGYGRTVNRPEFREKAPFNDFDYMNNETIRGNTNVITADIDNVDLRFEYYPQRGKKNEAITAGVFYKFLRNPIERMRAESSGFADDLLFPEISFFNAKQATVYGAELELRKSLSFIPGNLFRNFSIVVNGALIHSRAEVGTVDAFGRPLRFEEVKDSAAYSFTRRLQGQAPYVFNAGLYYENAGWGTKISVVYNVNGPNIYAASRQNPHLAKAIKELINGGGAGGNAQAYLAMRPSVLELSRHLMDISFQQRLLRTLQLRINIQNLMNQSTRFIEDNNNNYRYNKEYRVNTDGYGQPLPDGQYYYEGDNIYRSFNLGRYYTLTVTYAF